MKSITLIIFFICFSLHCYSQSADRQKAESDLSKKNASYGTGSVLYEAVSGTVSYERVLFGGVPLKHNFFVKGEVGALFSWGMEESGFIFGPQIGYLYGGGKAHLETSIGFYLVKGEFANDFSELIFRPSGVIGYRSQKPGGWFIFRTGFSYPLGVYVGFGVAF